MIIYLSQLFLEREKFRTKVVEKIKTHILGSVIFFSVNLTVYTKMLKNGVDSDRPQMTT